MRIKLSLILAIIGIILLVFVIYFFFIKEEKCYDDFCFLVNLRLCERASYNTGEWFYRIEGKSKDTCVVYVKNLALYGVDVEYANALKGKDMRCYIPLAYAGSYMPHENIDVCHGILKEAILDVMVKKMHQYIIQHIGEINISELYIT